MQAVGAEVSRGRVVLDYKSPHGAHVTHMRGMLLVNSVQNLKTLNMYERYMDLLPPRTHAEIVNVIASSWIDIELGMTHYAACEKLDVDDSVVGPLGARLCSRLAETWFGATLRASRQAGLESFGFALRQNDRIFGRMYRGGGCSVIEFARKEMQLEDYGNPLLSFRQFRVGYQGYMKAFAGLFCKTAFTREVRPSNEDAFAIATRFSWV